MIGSQISDPDVRGKIVVFWSDSQGAGSNFGRSKWDVESAM